MLSWRSYQELIDLICASDVNAYTQNFPSFNFKQMYKNSIYLHRMITRNHQFTLKCTTDNGNNPSCFLCALSTQVLATPCILTLSQISNFSQGVTQKQLPMYSPLDTVPHWLVHSYLHSIEERKMHIKNLLRRLYIS